MRGSTWLVALMVAALSAGCTLPAPSVEAGHYPAEVLGGAPWTSLVIEVDHAPGRAPSQAALDHLESTMREVTSKDNVRVVVRESLADDDSKQWTGEQLVELERATRDAQHEAPHAVVRVLYPAGRYHEPGIAGVAITGPVPAPAVVFLDTLREMQTGLLPMPLPMPSPSVERLERAVLLHEVGHAFGLVNNGIPMTFDREDPEHKGHSSNEKSVMYHKVETVNGLVDLLQEGTIPITFDAHDRADIRSVGGR